METRQGTGQCPQELDGKRPCPAVAIIWLQEDGITYRSHCKDGHEHFYDHRYFATLTLGA